MSDAVKRLVTLRLPGWVLFVLWIYFGVKAVFFSGWLQESFRAGLEYVREVSFSAPPAGEDS